MTKNPSKKRSQATPHRERLLRPDPPQLSVPHNGSASQNREAETSPPARDNDLIDEGIQRFDPPLGRTPAFTRALTSALMEDANTEFLKQAELEQSDNSIVFTSTAVLNTVSDFYPNKDDYFSPENLFE
mmetsp:Transcript_5331/g.19933  ORF Transcript_5331/g.19933 Transcript_5331/m.19933 type:complete len:129 (-) Transcript_5331:88-474(-)